MSTPFIVVSTQRIKEGKIEEYKQLTNALAEIFEAREPRLIAFNAFLNEDETEVTVIQVHPDAASMDFHLQVLREEVGKAPDKDHFDFSRMVRADGAQTHRVLRNTQRSRPGYGPATRGGS